MEVTEPFGAKGLAAVSQADVALRRFFELRAMQSIAVFGSNHHRQTEKSARKERFFLFGGGDGSRTRVRKPLDMTFSVGSLFFEFPLSRREQTRLTIE